MGLRDQNKGKKIGISGPRIYHVTTLGKGGNKFGADFRIPETQMELNEIA